MMGHIRKLEEIWWGLNYVAPEPLDDLRAAYEVATTWLNDNHGYPGGPNVYPNERRKELLRRFIEDCCYLMGMAQPVAKASEVLPPMSCNRCRYYNEYVGPEHLVNGVYICRSCR